METVCDGKRWDVALSFRKGEIVGAMPYLLGCRMGMRYILQPQLTQYNGPWYRYPEGLDECRRLSFEKQVAQDLWRQILALRPAYYQQNFSPAVTNWLPFHWAGCSQTTLYSYRLGDISDSQRLFDAFDRDERQKKILRLEPQTRIVTNLSPDRFARYHRAYWEGKGQRDLLSEEFITRLCSVATNRDNGMIVGLEDLDGNLIAARFVVYDDRCAYSLLSAFDKAHYLNGATETLVWGTLQALRDKTCAYDFEGSMDEGIEYFYRSFGAVQTPYFRVTRCFNPLFRVLLRAQQFKVKHF